MPLVKDVKAIIFDAGGTLIEGAMPWHQLYQDALSLTGAAMSPRRMVKCYEAAIRHMTSDKQIAVSADAIDTPKVRSLTSYLADELGLTENRLQHALDEVLFDHPEARHLVPVDGVEHLLPRLRARGYRLAMISNWSASLPLVLARLELKAHFEAIFASEALGYAKPNPAAFLVPLDRLGLTPGQAAYVGDLYDVDVLGSREVGMTPVLVDQLALGLHDDVPTVAHLSELLDLFPGC
jgi:FMN phosphatase YigB (HAD superfamily)